MKGEGNADADTDATQKTTGVTTIALHEAEELKILLNTNANYTCT